ncbi:MAG TPA: tetratricopeptide repeat protein, partial [Thermoanaerobaculia bacterium]|nr:tetratricopeptide repeat protein [Thermoanaerobaculia bacterium]
ADELVVALRRVEGVEVAAGSSLDAAPRGLGIAEVADRLGAGRVLDGAVERDGGRLRVEARLRDAADGRVVWSLARERPAGELFALQEELARAVLDRLAAASPAAGDPLIDRGTESLAAYSLYLKGREHWGRRDHRGLGRAIGYFERAIAEDPGYGRAWSGLADAHAWRTVYDPAADPDALAKARAAAGRALELAPGSAESHATLGLLALIGGEHAEAEAGLLRAIELDPRYAPARHWYGVLLARTLHRYDDAIAELERARRLDPGSSPILAMLAGAYYLAGRHEEALAAEEELVVLDPEWTVGGTCLARNHLALGRPREAIAAVARLPAALAGSVPCLRDLAQAHHLAGDYPAELAAARRGLALAPDDPYLVESEGAALAALGREEEVRALVGRVLGGFESGGYAWYGLFNVLGELRVHGRPELARELAREIAAWHGRRFPPGRPVDEATFLPALALVLARLEAGEPAGEPAAALAAWLAAAGTDVRRASGFSEHRLLGIEGWMAALAGDRATARARLAALDGHPADSEAAPYEAMILAALGEREGALAALDRRLAAGLVRNRELHVQVGLAPLAGPALERRLAARGPAAARR